MDLSRVTIVLDKVRHPDNLGSALRAMKNCGLTRLMLSDPHTRDWARASVLAVGADDLLQQMIQTEKLEQAVAHATLVAGTTSRKLRDRPTLWLRDFVARAAQETNAGGQVAIVFGNEQRGLSDAELDHCQLAINIPASPAKESINLAQSVMLVSHECYLASLTPKTDPLPEPLAANAGMLQALFTLMRQVLLQADFLNPQNPDAIMSELQRLVERARPSSREAELMLSAFKHLSRACKRSTTG